MATKYLKPMLDAGSPRVFNCNEITRKILAKDAAARPFLWENSGKGTILS